MKKFTPETTAEKDIKVIDQNEFEKIFSNKNIGRKKKSLLGLKEKVNGSVFSSKRSSIEGCNFIEKEKERLKQM